MKHVLLLVVLFVAMSISSLKAQVVFSENFEGTVGMTVTSTGTGTGAWGINTRIPSQGAKSDSSFVEQGTTTYLTTTNSFSTLGKYAVYLDFDQICKIEFADSAYIEVSNDNGTTWQRVMGGNYLGSAQFGNIGSRFNEASYGTFWDPSGPATPPQSWWKRENFDISSLVANAAAVKLRFVIADGNNTGAVGRNGWFLDSIVVMANTSELIPPTISLIEPVADFTTSQTAPYTIKAKIYDASGIDTAYVAYTSNGGIIDTIGMSMYLPDSFSCNIPFLGFGREIHYKVIAIDNSFSANVGVGPSTGTYKITTIYVPGMGSPTYSIGFETGIPAGWSQATTDDFDWTLHSGTTTSSGTGPSGAYEGTKYIYTESSSPNFPSKTAIITSSNYSLANVNNALFSFRYHMFGAAMGDLHFDVYSNGSWHNDVNILSGQTQTANAAPWTEAIVDISSYQTADFKFRFRGITGSSYTSDMCVDDIKIGSAITLPNDAGISEFTSPTTGTINNTAFNVDVKLNNYGSDTLVSADINWSLDGTAQTTHSYTGQLLSGEDSVVNIGSLTLAGGSYELKSWTSVPNAGGDMNFVNDTATYNFFVCNSVLSGVYTIDPSGSGVTNFSSFTDLELALMQCGINGPVTVNVASGTYNENFDLGIVSGSSATNTITIQSASGDSSTVTLAYDAIDQNDNFVVNLDGTSNISFKNITFEAQDSTFARVFVLDNGVENINFENNVIKTTVLPIVDDNNMALILAVGFVGNNVNITDNAMYGGAYGISLEADSIGENWVINNNIIHGNYTTAINILKSKSIQINSNNIQGDTIGNAGTYHGIYLTSSTGTAVIHKNSILTTASQIVYGIRMTNCEFDSINHTSVVNNFVQARVLSSSTSLSAGIINHQSKNVDYYFNTIRMSGNQSNSTSIALYDGTAGASKYLNVVNNIFANNAGGYLYYVNNVDTSLWNDSHNDLYNYNLSSNFAYLGTNVADYTEWLTKSGTSNCDTIIPYFVSDTDLHVLNNLMKARGLTIAGITTDIDGDTRSTTTPDWGADEFIPSPYDITTISILAPMDACGQSSTTAVTVRYRNIGNNDITANLSASYQLKGSSTPVTEVITATVLAGDTLDYTFTTTVDLDVSTFGADSVFEFKAWATLTGDLIHQNDTAAKEVLSGYIPAIIYATDDTVNYGQIDTLYAVGNNVYWWQTDTSTTELYNDSAFITPNLYDTTTYWVSDRAGTGSMSMILGTGVSVNNGNGYPTPYGNYYWGNREQYLVLASELTAMGISAGPIMSAGFNVITLNAIPVLNNYEVKIGSTSAMSLSSWQSNLTSVYTNSAYTATLGWNMHDFTTPFMWDGSSNIVIEVCSNNSGWISNGNASVEQGAMGFTASYYRRADQAGVCANTANGSTSGNRPNIKLSAVGQGCYGARSDVTVIVENIPSIDASIGAITSPAAIVSGHTDQEIKVAIVNYGTSTLTSLDIVYTLNTVMQDTFHWTGTIAYQNADTITIDTINSSGGFYDLVAWSSYPNNVIDTINSNDTAYFSFKATMNGTYTIGDTAGGNYFDFPTFTDAVDALDNAGIDGAVIFDVDSGNYNEQLVIPEIDGTSATNTVTFQSAAGDSTYVVLTYYSTSYSVNYTLKLDGCDYFTFQNMTIQASPSATYAGVIEMGGNSTHNNFYNNIIESHGTSSYARCFYSQSGNDNYTKIINNHIRNAYYGVYLRGSSSASKEAGNIVKGNLIEGIYYYGMYLYYQDSLEVSYNTVVDGATSVYGYGMYAYYCNNGVNINSNIFKLDPNNYKTAIYTSYCNGTANTRGLIANNMINITSGTGVNQGIYAYNSTFLSVYNNTVNITGGSASSKAANIYMTNGTADFKMKNNILRDSLGYTFYTTNMNGITEMDNNSHYSTSSNMAFKSVNLTDLAALQTATNMEAHSVFVDPVFVSTDDLHLASPQLSGLAVPLAEVPFDIDGKARSVIAPTIGAHEVDLLAIDMAVAEILQVPSNTDEFVVYPFSAVVRNNGIDTIFGFQLNYVINGGTAVVNTYLDTIAFGEIDTVSLTPFASPSGNSTICVTGVLAGDNNTFNDVQCQNFFGMPVKDAYLTAIEDIDGGCSLSTDTVVVWIKNIGQDTINAPSQTAQVTVSFMADLGVGATVTTENFNTVVNPGDSVSYQFTGLVDLTNTTQLDSTFTITAWVNYPGDNVSYNDTSYFDVESIHVPMDPVFTSPVTLNYATAALLSATATDSIYWYNYDTSSTEFYMGSNYQSGLFFANDTFYLEASTGGGVFRLTETVQFKGATGATNPYPSYLPGGDFDGVEISNVGMSTGDLGGYSIHVQVNSTNYSYTFPANSNIDGGDVALAIYGSGLTVGPSGNNVFVINSSTSISSSSVVSYWLLDASGVVVDAFAANGASFPANSGVTAADFSGSLMGGGSHPGAIRTILDNNLASDWQVIYPTPGSFGTFNAGLPQQGGSGCSSNRVPMIINVNPQQANDLHANVITSPVSAINLTNNEVVTVKIINFGSAPQSNFDVAYQVNNNTAVTATVSATIAANDTLDYTFGTHVDFSVPDSTYALMVYTDLTTDVNRLNDTVKTNITNQLPNYCVCKANSTSYEDMTMVSVGTWIHTDAASGKTYSDFTNVTPAIISANVTYPVSIEATAITGNYGCYANMFIDFNRDGDFDDNGELVFGGSVTPTSTISGSITIPYNALTGTTRMRVVLREGGTMSNTGPCGTYSWGETQDYNIFILDPIPHDAGVEEFVGLANTVTTNTFPLTARVRNYGLDTINTVDITYFVNGGTQTTVTYNAAPIFPQDSADVLLGNVSINDGMNLISAYTTLVDDSNTFNDTLNYNVFREAVVNLTYTDDFEGNDLWMPDTLLNQWERGIPTMTNINTAHSPVNVWGLGLDTNYENGKSQYLYSPKFVISSTIDSANLSFWHYYETQPSADGGYIQYRKNSSFWVALGYIGDTRATNWNNDATGGINKWAGSSNGWIESTYSFDFTGGEFANTDTIQLRYVFYANNSNNSFDGWAIDDFKFEVPMMPNDVGVSDIISPVTTAQIGETLTVKIEIVNYGSNAQTSIPVWYQVGSSAVVNETFTPTVALASGDTTIYTFSTTAIAPASDFIVCAGTDLTGDSYPQNDDKCGNNIVVTLANIDGGVTAIGKIQPIGGIDTTSILMPVVIKAEVKNFGVSTLTSFDVEYSIDNGATWTTEAWTGSIATNEVDTFQFATTYNSPLGNYSICIRTVVPNDAYSGNDMLCNPYIGSSVKDANGLGFEVSQNEPNPANGDVRINYIVPNNADVTFELRNTLGQIIYTVEQASFTGSNTIELDANKLANGVYYYSVTFDGKRITRKMIVNQ